MTKWIALLFLTAFGSCRALQPPSPVSSISRRSFVGAVSAVGWLSTIAPEPVSAAQDNGLILNKAASGLKWADAKMGTGEPLQMGSPASIDYSMASTAGRFPQIYTTKDKGTPYRFVLGDGSTIVGIEQAIVGTKDIPPMRPGGIRRVVVPANLGFQALAEPNSKCIAGEAIGPIPPKNVDSAAYQRWYQFYCNPRIPYQPDLVLDIKLYGKR
mmetsp:Transcript_16071/g.44233  ORF Transcript_16071/g.44233 Transcript_16071/m.44233 type:complete len:213 (-) Transcript_16071:157-795(-)